MTAIRIPFPTVALNLQLQPIATERRMNTFLAVRSLQDRRTETQCTFPCITEEGVVMIDRREYRDRRLAEDERESSKPLPDQGVRVGLHS